MKNHTRDAELVRAARAEFELHAWDELTEQDAVGAVLLRAVRAGEIAPEDAGGVAVRILAIWEREDASAPKPEPPAAEREEMDRHSRARARERERLDRLEARATALLAWDAARARLAEAVRGKFPSHWMMDGSRVDRWPDSLRAAAPDAWVIHSFGLRVRPTLGDWTAGGDLHISEPSRNLRSFFILLREDWESMGTPELIALAERIERGEQP